MRDTMSLPLPIPCHVAPNLAKPLLPKLKTKLELFFKPGNFKGPAWCSLAHDRTATVASGCNKGSHKSANSSTTCKSAFLPTHYVVDLPGSVTASNTTNHEVTSALHGSSVKSRIVACRYCIVLLNSKKRVGCSKVKCAHASFSSLTLRFLKR